jgi:protein-S-isoprenylcysteine O-methyltransferase Ste14
MNMPTILRHFLSILFLPFVVVIVVPYWLLDAGESHWSAGWPAQAAGAVCILAGLALFVWCVSLFARVGQGTLAPWDPPRNFVAVGPYRFVRNPMISAVVLLLIGQALFWGSQATGLWALIVVVINHLYFLALEEPGLEARFGESYRLYKANVPRWIPRLKPWPGQEGV